MGVQFLKKGAPNSNYIFLDNISDATKELVNRTQTIILSFLPKGIREESTRGCRVQLLRQFIYSGQ